MTVSAAVRQILERLDVGMFREAWPKIRPGQPAPRSDVEALALMHAARVLCAAIPIRLRRYSHEWLAGRGIAAPIPLDMLHEPPRFAEATGISVNASHPEVVAAISGVMLDALHESEAERDPVAVTRARMQGARHRERRALGLRQLI